MHEYWLWSDILRLLFGFDLARRHAALPRAPSGDLDL